MRNDGKEDERVSGVAQDSGDIVQIAESGDIDHCGAAAAEPSGTDTSDLTVPLLPPPFLSLALILPLSVFLVTGSLTISFSVRCIKNLFY